MKHTGSNFITLFSVLLLSCSIAGCQGTSTESQTASFPFTTLGWNDTVESMEAAEGSDYETYDSVYGGTTYTYSKEYLDCTGTVKYMFDQDDQLMCVAWAYTPESAEELDTVYSAIHEELVDTYGNSGYDNTDETNYGDVWYLDSGDIILSAVTMDSQWAFQYAYLNPAVSNSDDTQD